MSQIRTGDLSKNPRNKTYRKNWQLYLMLLLPLAWLISFAYKPMLGVIVAFKDFNIFSTIWDAKWVGLKHFRDAFGAREFWIALKNTLILNLGDVILGFPIPILFAIFLNELSSRSVRKITQTTLYLPNFLSWVIISGITVQLFSSNGLLSNLMQSLGGGNVNLMNNPGSWRFVYWIMGIWQGAGYSLIIYLAALAGTDPSLGEAAYIDGANRLQRIFHVTVPQIAPTITMMLILQLGKLISISFERPFLMGNALVRDASQVLSTYVYSVGLQSARFDFATAIGLFQSVVGVLLIFLFNEISKKFGSEGII